MSFVHRLFEATVQWSGVRAPGKGHPIADKIVITD